jgi:hypothetical protein
MLLNTSTYSAHRLEHTSNTGPEIVSAQLIKGFWCKSIYAANYDLQFPLVIR